MRTQGKLVVSSSTIIVAADDKRDCPMICNTMDLSFISSIELNEAADNAAHIVLCWNTHDELIEACQKATYLYESCGMTNNDEYKELCATLKAAKGEK